MALTISDVLTSANATTWTTKILGWATNLGLTATSWQPGGIARTLISVVANVMSAQDGVVTGLASAGWLDTAASVTPEGGPGWLDLVAQYVYNLTRNQATYGTTSVTLTNTGGPIGPLPAGTYHVTAYGTGHTYTNSASITIAGGTTTTIALVCDQAGVSDTDTTHNVTPITAYAGVTAGPLLTAAIGALAETNAALIARCKAKLASLATNTGTGWGYTYYATTTTAPGYPSLGTDSVTRTQIVPDTINGNVTVYLANSSGPVLGATVTAMQTYLTATVMPDGDNMTVAAASSTTINVTATAYCPAAYATQVTVDLPAAVAAYIAALPVGGEVIPGTSNKGLSYESIEDYIARNVTYLRAQVVTLNGLQTDVIMSNGQVAVAGTNTTTYGGI